jgi:hypothetical protein
MSLSDLSEKVSREGTLGLGSEISRVYVGGVWEVGGEGEEDASSAARARVRSSDQVRAVMRKREASFTIPWRRVQPSERVNPARPAPTKVPLVAMEKAVPAPKPAMEVERMLFVRGEEGRESRAGNWRYMVVRRGFIAYSLMPVIHSRQYEYGGEGGARTEEGEGEDSHTQSRLDGSWDGGDVSIHADR